MGAGAEWAEMWKIGLAGAAALLSAAIAVASAEEADFTMEGELVRPDGWREWIFVGAPLTPNALNDGEAAFPEFHNVYIDPESCREQTELTASVVVVGPVDKGSGAERPSPYPLAGRVEADHAACLWLVLMGDPSAWYRARQRGPWKTARVRSGYSWTRTLALT